MPQCNTPMYTGIQHPSGHLNLTQPRDAGHMLAVQPASQPSAGCSSRANTNFDNTRQTFSVSLMSFSSGDKKFCLCFVNVSS